VHGLRPGLPHDLRQDGPGVAAPHVQPAAERVVQGGQAAHQVGEARGAGGPPEARVQHVEREHVAVGAGGGVEGGVVAQAQVAAEPVDGGHRRHGSQRSARVRAGASGAGHARGDRARPGAVRSGRGVGPRTTGRSVDAGPCRADGTAPGTGRGTTGPGDEPVVPRLGVPEDGSTSPGILRTVGWWPGDRHGGAATWSGTTVSLSRRPSGRLGRWSRADRDTREARRPGPQACATAAACAAIASRRYTASPGATAS
jgi:hypothetical protein